MARLLWVEFTRLRWRRATKILLLVGLVITAIVLGSRAWDTRPMDEGERERLIEQALQDDFVQAEYNKCLKEPGDFGLSDADACRDLAVQMVGGFVRPQLDLGGENAESNIAVAFLAVLLAVLVGATFIGADFASGSVSNQMLFVSQRLRVWFAKSVVAALAGSIVCLLMFALFWLGLWYFANLRGISTSAETWREIVNQGARGTGLAAAAGFGGFSLTTLFRNTIGTLGFFFALTFVGSIVLLVLPIEGTGRYMVTNNLLAVLQDGFSYFDPTLCRNFDPQCDPEQSLSLAQGMAYFAALAGASGLLSIWSFMRRDLP
jgi:ABC-2 type transport system permease protein